MAAKKSKTQGILQGYDALLLEGQDTELKAKLEIKGFLTLNPNVAGEAIRFFYGTEFIGESKTLPSSGMATFRLPPLPIGNHVFKIQLTEETRFDSKPASLTVSVISPTHPIAITDIDHTILDAGYLDAFLKRNKELQAMADSPECLAEISKEYQVIYITSREEFLTNKTRRWLELRGFPIGPIFFWDLMGKGIPLSHAKYKLQLVSKLKKQFPKIVVGFGDREGDAIAYTANNIRAYIMPSKKQAYPAPTLLMSNWKEILEHLKKNPLR